MPVQPLARFGELVDSDAYEGWRAAIQAAAEVLRGRVVWHVSSTARGGGVAEMMGPLIGYARDAGVDARWMVIAGSPEFFALTKRLHNRLHADAGDGGPLGPPSAGSTSGCSARTPPSWPPSCAGGDVVVLHDPQTAGLARPLARPGRRRRLALPHRARGPAEPAGAGGLGVPAALAGARATRRSSRATAYVPAFCRDGRVAVIRPAIDPFSPKNQEMAPPSCARSWCGAASWRARPTASSAPSTREDGSPGRVDRGADILRLGRAPDAETPLVVQVSRWDRLKDHLGVMHGFARLEEAEAAGAHLVLAGPVGHGRRRRPRGARGARRAHRGVARPAAREPPPGPDRQPADGRRRRERRDGERPAAPRRRDRAEEPAGGVRADGHRGDVEGAPGRGERGRRHRRPDRRRLRRRAAVAIPPTSTGSPPRCDASWAIPPRRAVSARRRTTASGRDRWGSGCWPTTPG